VPHPLTGWERATAVDTSPTGTPFSAIRCLGSVATVAAPVIAAPCLELEQGNHTYVATVASRPKVVDGAAPNHVSLRRAHERNLCCDYATYPYDVNAIFQNRIQGHIKAHDKSITRSFNQSALNYSLF